MNQRETKGQEIAEKNNQIKRIDELHYTVNSQSRNQTHEIISTEFSWTCSCEDHQFRGTQCKHIHAVEISLNIRAEVKKHIIDTVNSSACQFCNSDNISKWGIRHNKNYDLQIYKCKNCLKKFSINIGFEGMRATPQIITNAMQLYFTGESLRNVQKFIKLQGINFSHVAIYEWVKKYISLMDNYLKTITPQVGDRWHADEVWLKIKGDKKYLFAMMDNDTRFWIAQEVADSKFNHDARKLLQIGKKVTKKIPSVFVTDGLPAYNEAFKKEFAPKNDLQKPSKHIKDIHFKNEFSNNNIQERLNGEFRDREKTFRGLKKVDSHVITGIQLYHNYIRSHMSLDGDTPAKRAGIEIKGNNKWLTIIQNASIYPSTLNKENYPSSS